MKGIAKPSIYFSAYPLKVAEQKTTRSNESSQSPYLRSLLAGRGKSTSRIRVFPMINPYKEKDARPVATTITVSKQLSRVPEDIELTEKQWFHNYE